MMITGIIMEFAEKTRLHAEKTRLYYMKNARQFEHVCIKINSVTTITTESRINIIQRISLKWGLYVRKNIVLKERMKTYEKYKNF